MPPATDESTSRGDGVSKQLDELGTTNKVLADTRADQVTLRAAVREFTGTNGNNTGANNGHNNNNNANNHVRIHHEKPPDLGPRIRLDPPRFNGDNTEDWIDRVETYFDYNETPAKERLYLVRMLMDAPASAWFRYYRANNCDSSWEDFLVAVRHRFDPDYYIDYVGVLSNLR